MAEVSVHGVRLHVQRIGRPAGEAPAAVFLHGLIMDNLSSWYFTAANRVADFAHVILYDYRGHGRSERPLTGYALADFVRELDGLLDELGIEEPVQLVGNSFGALLALTFCLEHPERVAGLILVDALLPEPEWGRDMIATLSLEGEERDQRIAESFKAWLGRHSERKRTRLAQNAEALVHGTSLVNDLRGSHHHPDEDYELIAVPTLAVYGAESDQRERGYRLAERIDFMELHVLPGCTHSVLWERTAELTTLITDTLKDRCDSLGDA